MKKLFVYLMILFSLVCFAACGGEEAAVPEKEAAAAPTMIPEPGPTPTPDPWIRVETKEEAEEAAGFSIRLPIMEEASITYNVMTLGDPIILEAVFEEGENAAFSVRKAPGGKDAFGDTNAYPYNEETKLFPDYFPVTLSGESDQDIRLAAWVQTVEDVEYSYCVSFAENTANYAGALKVVNSVAEDLPDVDARTVASSIIACGESHTVAIKKDGTVVATGNNQYGQCDVLDWTDIVAVAAGPEHTVGLRKDGTVVAAGLNNNQQCEVEEWTEVIKICTNQRMTFGLRADGTIVHTHLSSYVKFDIEQVAAVVDAVDFAPNSILHKDNSLTSLKPVFKDPNEPYVFSKEAQVEQLGSPIKHLCSIKLTHRQGWGQQLRTMVYTLENGEVWGDRDGRGEMTKLDELSDSVYVTGGFSFIMGLKKDGSVVCASYNPSYFDMDFGDKYERSGELACREWTDIIAIAGNDCVNSNRIAFSAGVHSDGTVVAVGSNDFGQCDVSDWTDIGYPYHLADTINEPVNLSFAELF